MIDRSNSTHSVQSAPSGALFTGMSRPTALVVDQDELARTITVDMVAAAGFDVHAASCCDSAIAYVVSHGGVDVLLAAVHLPEMPGNELAAIIAKDYPDMCSIFLLAPGEEDSHTPALRKPFTVQDLERVLAPLERKIKAPSPP